MMSEQTPPSARPAPPRPLIPIRREDVPEAAPIDYRVHHLTRYRYAKPVTCNYGRAHVEPRATPAQRVLSHEVEVQPEPAVLTTHTDFYGNSSIFLMVDEPHEELEVHSRARVTVLPRTYSLEHVSVPWQHCTPDHWGPLMPLDSADFVLPSPRITATDDVRDLAAQIFTPERPIGDCLAELTHLIHREFRYTPGVTTVSSTIDEVLGARHGVCQDFSHVAIAIARSAGLAARYVSGYLRTAPSAPGNSGPDGHGDPGDLGSDGDLGTEPADEMIGSAASHAWASILVPGSGWVDIDPTNNTFVDQRFVTTAWGRDYTDVPPLKGIVVGPKGATSTLKVAVGVVPLPTE